MSEMLTKDDRAIIEMYVEFAEKLFTKYKYRFIISSFCEMKRK
jgi:hypothetical protein